MKKFDGIYPALITPFRENGSVNESVLLDITDRMLEQRADGLYLMGSTGEAFLMSEEERIKTVALLAKHIAGRCRIIVHVGALSTAQCIEMAKKAWDSGADIVSAIAPFYYALSFEELETHFLSIAGATPLPFLLYNFPRYSGVQYNVEQLLKLMESPDIIGVKYTDMNLFNLERLKRGNLDALLFSGHDEVYVAACAMGVTNAIGSTFNIMLPKYQNIKRLVEQGRYDLACKEQEKANDVIDALIKTGVISGIKYLLSKKGYDIGVCKKPFGELSGEKRLLLDSITGLLDPIY